MEWGYVRAARDRWVNDVWLRYARRIIW